LYAVGNSISYGTQWVFYLASTSLYTKIVAIDEKDPQPGGDLGHGEKYKKKKENGDLYLPPLVGLTLLIRYIPAIPTVGLENGLQHESIARVTFFNYTIPLIRG
jgi:hypothetical protein